MNDAGSLYSNKFGSLFNSYARSFNKVHNRNGSLFSVKSFQDWRYFSYHKILNQKEDSLIKNSDEVLELFNGKDNYEIYHTLDLEIDIE